MGRQKEIGRLVNKAYSKCLTSGCSDRETDILVDKVVHVYHILGEEKANDFVGHVTEMNPDYELSQDKAKLERQLEGWIR